MGEEIDSLADAVNFGVAPAFIVYGDAAVALAHRLDRRAAVRGVHRAAAGAVQRDARPWTSPPTPRSTSSACPRPAGAIGAIGPLAAKMQFGDGWWTSEPAVVIWMVGVSLLVVSTHPDAQDPHLLGVAEHGRAAAGAAGDRGRRVDPLRLHRDPADHRRPTSSTSRSRSGRQRWLAAHPEVWGRQAPAAARRPGGRSAGPSRPHRRSMARLGLRRPPGA